MVRWEGGRFLVLLKRGGRRVSSRFHTAQKIKFAVKDFFGICRQIQNKFKIFLRGHRDGKTLLRSSASC